MALRHYGGSTPSMGPSEWTCPGCGHTNSVPLKAGCQQCGKKDGDGARKVGEPAPPLPIVGPQTAAPVPDDTAFRHWLTGAHGAVTTESYEIAKEAWMAGVAWVQAQQGTVVPPGPVGPPLSPGDAILAMATGDSYTLYTPPPVTLMLQDKSTVSGATGWAEVDVTTLQTILAALAFYRDNVLGYGGLPGQLDAVGVNELIARLSPQDGEVHP